MPVNIIGKLYSSNGMSAGNTYACVETLIQFSGGRNTGPYLMALRHLYGASAEVQAQALIAKTSRFRGMSASGLQMDACAMQMQMQMQL